MRFEVPGKPQGKGRTRSSNGKHYTPEETVMYENWIKICYQQQANKHLGEGPISLTLTIYYPIPKSATKGKRLAMENNIIRPTIKPDSDNVLKAVADSLNKIAYKDDSQIVSVKVEKYYSDNPGLVITLEVAN